VFTGLRITALARSGADLQLSLTSQIGHTYTVQGFTSLADGVVRDLITGIPGTGGTIQTTISNTFVYPQQFFRIMQEQ